MTVGEKLRNLRANMKKTLGEQSIALGVAVNSIYRWENDKSMPKKSTLKHLAEFYDVPLEWLTSDNYAIDKAGCVSCYDPQIDDVNEQDLILMFRKLTENKKHRVLGYIERMCIE